MECNLYSNQLEAFLVPFGGIKSTMNPSGSSLILLKSAAFCRGVLLLGLITWKD